MSKLALQLNQTFQTAIIGMVTMDPQPNTIPAQINPSSSATTGTLVAGSAVKLSATASPGIVVDLMATPLDGPAYGVIIYNMKKNSYVAGDYIEVAADGNIVMLKSGSAISAGQRVILTNATVSTNDPTVDPEASGTNGDHSIGFALTGATAAGQLVKVQIKPALQGTYSANSVAP